MDDDKLISIIAQLWLSNGGDSEGFKFCVYRIQAEIEYLEWKRKENDNENWKAAQQA